MKKVLSAMLGMLVVLHVMDANAGIADFLKGKKHNTQSKTAVVSQENDKTKNRPVNMEAVAIEKQMTYARNIFVAIIQANTEREACGFDSVWPNTKAKSNDHDDIAGMKFTDSVSYFKTLLDVGNINTDNWAPYVCGIKPSTITGGKEVSIDGSTMMWSILADVTSSMDDALPVMISANFDCTKLPARWDGLTNGDSTLPLLKSGNVACELLGDSGVIVLYKGGACRYFKSSEFTLNNLFAKKPNKSNLTWLMPSRISR